MLLIERPQTDPFFNIAAEEYLLKNVGEDCFMLWASEPSIIIGKHQNAFAEINSSYARSHHLPVIRRISGGGTVFHDPGNLNFSFIRKGEREKLVDFRKFTEPIIDYLTSLGLPAKFEGKNDIRVNGLKISGNAEHVYRDKVLHHGTLLFSAQLDRLNKAIRGQELLFADKAVKSVRSTVTNITGLLDRPLSLDDFRQGIIDHMKAVSGNWNTAVLSGTDVEAIESLAQEKYTSWEWNFGYSPRFTYEKGILLNGQTVVVTVSVKHGLIEGIHATGDHTGALPFDSLTGLRFDADFLLANFRDTGFPRVYSLDEYRGLVTQLMY